MRDIRVERDFEKPHEWNVFDIDHDEEWLGTFRHEADAQQFAELKRADV